MIPPIPQFFRAQDVNALAVTPASANCSGAITLATGEAFDVAAIGLFDRFEFRGSRGLFEWSASNALVTNHVPSKVDWEVTLSAFDGATKANPLIDLWGSYDLVRIAAQGRCPAPNGATVGKILVVFGRLSDMTTGIVEGRNATIITVRTCGILPEWATTPTI